MNSENIRKQIASLVHDYAKLKFIEKEFKPGRSIIPPSGKVIGEREIQYMEKTTHQKNSVCGFLMN